ncbi:unnamed protein product [Diabrotica balteata]|uniref:Uncharacterized protein n=1 Tax=Diabrotica balteata TaxID=107213 RepID=A0A9N9X6W0_DIABA|nr:unnamed protein product [Diabrotica balteata]
MAEAQVSNVNHEELLRKVDDLEKRLQTKDAEIQVYKMLMSQMEEEAAQAKKYKALHEKQTQDVDTLRTESEKTLTKAKSMIFEKTKIIKNQELQIEAFTQQIESLREVVRITKDLLEIRNMEVKQLEIKIESIEGKQKAEKERYDLMHKKLEMMIRHNAELKREYETQLCLFTALRERYNERELAKDVIDNLKTPALKIASQNETNTAQKEIKVNEELKGIQPESKSVQLENSVGEAQKSDNSVVPNQEKPIESSSNISEQEVNKQKSADEQNTATTVESASSTNQPEPNKAVTVDQNKISTPTEQIVPKLEDSIPVPNEVIVVSEASKPEKNVIEQNKQSETNNNINSSEQKTKEPVITEPKSAIKEEKAEGQSNNISEQTVVKTDDSVAAPIDQTNQDVVAQSANIVKSSLTSDVPASVSVDVNPVNKEVSLNNEQSQPTNEVPVVVSVDSDLVKVDVNNDKVLAPAPQVANVQKKE